MFSLSSSIHFSIIKVPYYVVTIKSSAECSDMMITSIALVHIVLMMRLLDNH